MRVTPCSDQRWSDLTCAPVLSMLARESLGPSGLLDGVSQGCGLAPASAGPEAGTAAGCKAYTRSQWHAYGCTTV